jgi:UTP-glucose-1-phosphate uridylyltransferase/transcriptional regulator with XRE-family HTH domain
VAEGSEEFGRLLRQAREAAGLSREQLAKRGSFNPSHIHRLESGSRRPSRKAVIGLAEALELDSEGLSAWLVAAGFAPPPLLEVVGAGARTRGALQSLGAADAGPPRPKLAQQLDWLEGMGLREEKLGRLLRRMATAGFGERQRVAQVISRTIAHLTEVLEAPVHSAVIPAAAGHQAVSRPLVQRMLLRTIGEASAAGISRVVLVIAPGAEEYLYAPLRDALELSIAPSVELSYVFQSRPEGLGDAILQAESFVRKEPFAVLLPDDLLQHDREQRAAQAPELRRMAEASAHVSDANLIAVTSVPRSKMPQYGVAKVSAKPVTPGVYRVEGLIEKPGPASPISRSTNVMGIVGRYLLRPDIFHVLREMKLKGGRPVELTAALETLRQKGQKSYAYELNVPRHDMGEAFMRAGQFFRAVTEMSAHRKKEF